MSRFFDRYFSFGGRLARLPFFIGSVYLSIPTWLLYLITIALFSSRTSPGYWVGLVMVGACLMLLCVCAVSLVVRRLHDLRLSGYHVIWVAAVPEVISTVLSYGPAKEVLVELPPAAVSLWLLLWPGNKMSNRFGEVPQ